MVRAQLVRLSLHAANRLKAPAFAPAFPACNILFSGGRLSRESAPDQTKDCGHDIQEAPSFSRSFFHTSSPACDASISGSNNAGLVEERRRSINKILYRSRQRGLLELDLLIGKWATDNVPKMDIETLEHYTRILDEENPDLWKWLTEQADPPADLKANPVFASLCEFVRKDLEAKANPATRTEPGRAWVRGWNDGDQRKVGGPPAGNQ